MTWIERPECESMIFYDKDKFKITDGYEVLYLTHDYILNKRIDGIKHHILTYFGIFG